MYTLPLNVCYLFIGNGADLNVTSPDLSPYILIGDTIDLNISYSGTPTIIMWTANDSLLALFNGGQQKIPADYKDRLTLNEKSVSIKGSTKADSGEYNVTVTDTDNNSGFLVFHVVVRGKSPGDKD